MPGNPRAIRVYGLNTISCKARGFPALTFPRGEDSATLRVSRASYEAALHAALAWPLLTKLCFGAPHGVS